MSDFSEASKDEFHGMRRHRVAPLLEVLAELFGPWYYLYLVPVAQGNRPDIQSMRVVRDPCNTILRANSEWLVETNIMRCSLI